MAVAAAVLFHLTRGFTFFYDEWNFLMNRQEFSADALLAPHNEHNVMVTVLLFKGLWELAGLGVRPDKPWPEILRHLKRPGARERARRSSRSPPS